MTYKLRDYQVQASNAGVRAFRNKRGGLIVAPTGSGKSLIIADMASRLDTPLLVFQPNKEILEQNLSKLRSYGCEDCAVYSASLNSKRIARITFATIGSVMNHKEDFDVFRNIIIDEAHLVNSKEGQYREFLLMRDRTAVGLTATPYRLSQAFGGGSVLKFLTRTRPRIFDKVIQCTQTPDLLSKGYLADISYYDLTSIDLRNVRSNSTGAEYDEKSLIIEYERTGFYDKLFHTTMRVLHPKSGVPRKGILVFTRFTKEAEELTRKLSSQGIKASIVTGETQKKERETIIKDFKSGDISVVSNVGVLSTGFDYPELDTAIIARPTKSLALYYQMVGRIIRPSQDKDAWCIDLGGSYRRFGKVSDLRVGLEKEGTERWAVFSRGRQLTNVIF